MEKNLLLQFSYELTIFLKGTCKSSSFLPSQGMGNSNFLIYFTTCASPIEIISDQIRVYAHSHVHTSC